MKFLYPSLSIIELYVVFDYFSTPTLGLAKISALLFFRRIFCDRGRRTFFNAITITTIVIVSLWMVTYLVLFGLQCGVHFSALWTGTKDYSRYCAAIARPALEGFAISDFLLDVWILSLPVPQASISRFNLPKL
jgi:hypothetical protein